MELEALARVELGEFASQLDGVMSMIGRSYPLISDSVESSKNEFKKAIDDCRRELVEKYAGHENIHRDITVLANMLNELRPLFVLRNGGAYDQAIAYFIDHLRDPINITEANSSVRLAIFEQHAEELRLIERDFSEDADWNRLAVSMNDFYGELNRSADGSGLQAPDYPLN